MKKTLTYASVALLVLCSASCSKDFLSIDPVGSVSEATLANADGVDMTLNGAYAAMYGSTNWWYGLYSSITNWAYGDMMGGDANKGSTATDQVDLTGLELASITSGNGQLQNKWEAVYDGIYRANNAMHLAGLAEEELSALSGEVKDKYTETIAQATMLRAYFEFEAARLFGGAVPYISLEDFESATDPAVPNVDENGNYVYIWDDIVADLEYAAENLPETWTTDYGRFNKWGAKALLAKVMIYRASPYNGANGTEDSSTNWNEIKTLVKDIIDNGKDAKGNKYCLTPNYETLWVAGESDWTGESVLDLQTAISGTETQTNSPMGSVLCGLAGAVGAGWGFYQPSYDIVKAFEVNDKGLPYLDSYHSLSAVTTQDGSAANTDLTRFEDPRIDVSVGRFNTPFWDWAVPSTYSSWVRDPANGGMYTHKKMFPKKADVGSLSVSGSYGQLNSVKNYHVIRFAEVLLWYAEACIKTGDLATAREYVNKVRARAQNSYVHYLDPSSMEEAESPYVMEAMDDAGNVTSTSPNAAGNYRIGLYPASQFATEDGAWAALRMERRLELALEGQRWFDLTRWGIYADEINTYFKSESVQLPKYASSTYGSGWYCMPIPESEIVTMDGKLVQNSAWK